MNEHFISIKVHREERPDLDSIYMQATTRLTGSGGWPMSVFPKPDLRPFYAGPIFHPRRAIACRPSARSCSGSSEPGKMNALILTASAAS